MTFAFHITFSGPEAVADMARTPLDFDRADRIEAAIAQGIADGAAGPTGLPPFVLEG